MSDRTEFTSLEAPGRSDEELREAGPSALLARSREVLSDALASLKRHPHRYAVGALTLLFATFYVIAGIVEHKAYRTALLDLGIYDQAMREYAAFHLPRVPLFGVRTPDHAGLLHWTDHFTPILLVLTPLYWVHDGPESLLVAHGLLFALAIPSIWLFARRALGATTAYLVAFAFGMAWPIQEALWVPFHQVAFAMPILAAMLERYQAREHRHAALLALSLLFVREDLGLVVSTFGLFLLALGERRLGAALSVIGVTATAVLIGIVIPLLGGSPRRNWTYSAFGGNPFELLLTIVRSPIATLEYALTPADKVRTLLWLFVPLLCLSFGSRLLLLAVPMLAVRFLSTQSNYWTIGHHYNAYVIPVVFAAAVDTASRLPQVRLPALKRSIGLATLWSVTVCLLALMAFPRWPGWAMTRRWWWYPRTPAVYAAEQALMQVPNGAFVAASNNAGIHLTHRAKVILWVPPGDRREVEAVWQLDGLRWRYLGDRRLAEPDWVVADTARAQFPFRSLAEQRQAVELLIERGYVATYEAGGFVVLHRSE